MMSKESMIVKYNKNTTASIYEHLPSTRICQTFYIIIGMSLVAQMVKNLPAMQESWVYFLGWKDHLKKEMATHSSILAWKIPWKEEPGRLQSIGSQRVGHDWRDLAQVCTGPRQGRLSKSWSGITEPGCTEIYDLYLCDLYQSHTTVTVPPTGSYLCFWCQGSKYLLHLRLKG